MKIMFEGGPIDGHTMTVNVRRNPCGYRDAAGAPRPMAWGHARILTARTKATWSEGAYALKPRVLGTWAYQWHPPQGPPAS